MSNVCPFHPDVWIRKLLCYILPFIAFCHFGAHSCFLSSACILFVRQRGPVLCFVWFLLVVNESPTDWIWWHHVEVLRISTSWTPPLNLSAGGSSRQDDATWFHCCGRGPSSPCVDAKNSVWGEKTPMKKSYRYYILFLTLSPTLVWYPHVLSVMIQQGKKKSKRVKVFCFCFCFFYTLATLFLKL